MRSFWTAHPVGTTLVGALVIGVIVGILVVPGDSDDGAVHVSWIRQADRLCGRAADHLAEMPPVHISTYGSVVPAMAKNERTLAAKLGDLDAPEKNRASIERLVGLLDRQSSEADAASSAYTEGIDFSVYRRHVRKAKVIRGEIAIVARTLGAKACAQPPVRTRYL